MRNPLNEMKIRSNMSHNQLMRERSEIHNIYGHHARVNKDGTSRPHYGWDLLAEEGTPVFAITGGTVVRAWRDHSKKNYGSQIEIEFSHDGKTYHAFYGHLNDIYVQLFDQVPEGKVLGVTGHTGNAHNLSKSQYHLHFEIRTPTGDGSHGAIDPAKLLGGDMLICHAKAEPPSLFEPNKGPQFCPDVRTGPAR